MKKCLSISCILLAVVTMFSLYCYRERENKNLVASIEPYTETAVILSDYIDFEKSIYIGSKISRNYWLFEPKCRNNAEIIYTQRLQIASYFP